MSFPFLPASIFFPYELTSYLSLVLFVSSFSCLPITCVSLLSLSYIPNQYKHTHTHSLSPSYLSATLSCLKLEHLAKLNGGFVQTFESYLFYLVAKLTKMKTFFVWKMVRWSRSHWCIGTAVWPDAGIKSSLNCSKSWPNNNKTSLDT